MGNLRSRVTPEGEQSPGADAHPGKLVAYFGHHKCATQWMKGLVRGIGAVVGRTVHRYSHARGFGYDLSAIPEPASTIICYTNADFHHVAGVDNLRGWHMVRDPRDIVVSSYFSYLHSHPAQVYGGKDDASRQRSLRGLPQHRETLRAVTQSEGLMLELQRRGTQFRVMAEWDYDQENVLELRMEDVIEDAVAALRDITSFVGLYGVNGLDDLRLTEIVEANSFSVYAGGRAPGEEDPTSHYRKGVPGDWKLHFGPEHIDYFKQHYNDLLVQLGYEASVGWG
jgi:Sulfotransferase domain